MYTTMSPCPMCTGAILLFQIPRVVVGEAETFLGDLTFLSDQGVEVVLLDDERCKAATREFQERYPGSGARTSAALRVSHPRLRPRCHASTKQSARSTRCWLPFWCHSSNRTTSAAGVGCGELAAAALVAAARCHASIVSSRS